MAVNVEIVAEKVFNLLAGNGYDISNLNSKGEKVIDPQEATRFVVVEPNILVRLDKATETLSMGVRESFEDDNLRDAFKQLAGDYLMNFDFRIFGKTLKPKSETIDIAKRSEKKMGDVLEALNDLRKLAGLEENTKDNCTTCDQDMADCDCKLCKDCDAKGCENCDDGKILKVDQKESVSNLDEFRSIDFATQQEVDDVLDRAFTPGPGKPSPTTLLTLKGREYLINQVYDVNGVSDYNTAADLVSRFISQFESVQEAEGDDYNGGLVGIKGPGLKVYFDFLDDLRDSGQVNMFGARGYLMNFADNNNFSLDIQQAREILQMWMKSKEQTQEAHTKMQNGCTVYSDGSPLSFADWRSETERETGRSMKRSPEDQERDYNSYVNRCNESVWENISEGFSTMSGSSKTSYQGLDNVKLVVRHKKEVNEEVRGSRSRNIHSIFIQRGDERFKMAENNLKAARAMARHVKNGGEPFDTVGSAINEMAVEQRQLREFVRYVKKSGLVNEENESYVNIAMENINYITTAFTKLAGVKSYANAVEDVSDRKNTEVLENDLDLESKFTETHFDDRVATVMGSIKSAMSRKTSFESYIDKVVKLESFASLKNMLSENDGMEFATPHAKLGYQVSQMSNSVADSRLGNYLTGISKKLYSGDRMSQHEYTTIKSCLLGAHKGHEVPTSVAESVEDQYEKFLEQFDIL